MYRLGYLDNGTVYLIQYDFAYEVIYSLYVNNFVPKSFEGLIAYNHTFFNTTDYMSPKSIDYLLNLTAKLM